MKSNVFMSVIGYGMLAPMTFTPTVQSIPAHSVRSVALVLLTADSSPLPDTVHRSGSTPDSALPSSLATITVDTGALQAGHTNFLRYSNVGLCLAAARTTEQTSQRSLAAQTVMLDPDWQLHAQGTLPLAGVVDVARTCSAHFTVANTKAQDLAWLFQLALLAQNDTLAHAVLQRRLALASGREATANIFLETIDAELQTLPARVPAADSIASRLDAMGPQALPARVAARSSLLDFAFAHFDTAEMWKNANQIIALGRLMSVSTADGRNEVGLFAVHQAYKALSALAFVQRPDSLLPIATRAKMDLGRFGPPKGLNIFPQDFSQLPVSGVLHSILPYQAEGPTPDSVLSPLNATYWFPKRPDHWPPGTGPISIIVYGGGDCFNGEPHRLDDANCPQLGKVKTWAAKYKDQVAFTVVVPLVGSAVRSLALPPEQEAEQYRWYFLDYLKFPATVAILALPRRQLPDGRIFYCFPGSRWEQCRDTSANDSLYIGDRNDRDVQVLRADGRLLYRGAFTPTLDALLERLVRTPQDIR